MKLEITKEEYRSLLDLLYMGNWVLHAHKTEADPRTKPYDEVIQKLYSSARAGGFGEQVEYDHHERRYYPTADFENTTKAVEFIDEFVDDSFWDELVYRLAERDVAQRTGGYEQLRLLSREDRSAMLKPAEKRYSDEFNENGIDHLVLAEQFGIAPGQAVKTSD